MKAEAAKSRIQDRERKELSKPLARERRLSRAAIQRNSTLDKLHQMDWSTTAILEEGEGKRMEKERVEPFDLIAANSVGWERKRKRGKKLRWSAWARRRAAVGGKIVRRVLKGRRKLDKMEWEQDSECWLSDKELKEQSMILEEGMQALRIDKELEQENESIPVEEAISLMAGLQLLGEGLRPWESEEHQWVEGMDTTNEEQELIKIPWFDWGEEKREHWDLEKLIQSLDLNNEEPEPSQAGNPAL